MGDAGEEDAATGPLDRSEVLHTGDIVLLKCSLLEDPSAEALRSGTGFLTGDAVEYVPKVEHVSNFATDGLDFRDFLFVVVDQLSYRALKDLRKRKKLLAALGGGSGTSLAVELRNLEERARREHEENLNVLSGVSSRAIRYGDVVQLQHIRTGMYMGVRAKASAQEQATSRRVELQDGTMASWLTVNPFFSHRTQGELVSFNEMVSLESVKLSENWNLNWHRYNITETGEEAYEVNCCRGGRGFYFMLYSRRVALDPKGSRVALSFGLPIRLYSPHRRGFLAASCSLEKKAPYMRAVRDETLDIREFCAKDIWVIEPVSHEFLKDTGIEYSITPVLLRHLGSGYYLAISEADLQEKDIIYNKDDVHGKSTKGAGDKRLTRGQTANLRYQEVSAAVEKHSDPKESVATELVQQPTVACVFTLEMGIVSLVQHEKMYIPAESPCVMIKWDRANWPLWLSCEGHQKGMKEKPSLMLEWSKTRSLRDALRVEIISDRASMNAFDTVVYHRKELKTLLPPLTNEPHMSVDKWIYQLQKAERAFGQMIFFLSHSLNWQAGSDGGGSSMDQRRKLDPLKEAWSADPQRQRFVRELKYIDATVSYFHALANTMPEMQEKEIDFNMRLKGKATGTQGNFDSPGSKGAKATKDDGQQVAKQKARVLKVLVRLWLYCFLRNHTNENFFYMRGYMDIIDDMNGRGLGASDVFVTLLSQNRDLVRKVKPETVTRFLKFIRILGPLDTWLQFLKALCDPQNGGALSDKQQLVLSKIAFPGLLAPQQEKTAVERNREELMIALALEGPIGKPLARLGQVDPKDCLGTPLLTHGIHDVAIAWAHPVAWEVGKVLYHGPEQLNLPILRTSRGRKWVSLAQVVWVLQPKQLCQEVTGQSWATVLQTEAKAVSSDWQHAGLMGQPHKSRDAGNPFDVSRIDLLRMLARYCQAQLQLVASLAKDRQMNSIMALQEEYSYKVCLSGAADSRLPSSIRASFFDLLMALWVDRHPHYQVVVPRLMRSARPGQAVLTLPVFRLAKEAKTEAWTAEHAKSLSDEVLSFYNLRTTEKLEGLVQAVCHYLTGGPKVEHQVHSQEDDNKLTLAVVQTLQFLLRFGFIRSFEICSRLHPALLRLLDGRTDFLDPPEALGEKQRMEGTLGQSPERSPLLGVGAEVPASGVRRPPTNDSARRFLQCDENITVVNSKVSIAQALLQLRSLGLDVQISQVLVKFQEFAAGHIPLAAMVDTVIAVMDHPVMPFSQPGLRSPNAMLIDLLMYEDGKILPLALELICGNSYSAGDFLEELEKVTLLTEQQDALMQQLKSDVAQMSKILYSFENWSCEDEFSISDRKPLNELEEIGKRLQKACSGNAPASGRMVQDMLIHTDFVSIAGYWLMLDWQDTNPESRLLHRRLTAIVCSIATAFCRNNPKNQGVFMDFLPGLSKVLDEDDFPESAALVAEIFRGNLTNCEQVPEELIEDFGNQMVRTKRAGRYVPWYTFFFSSIVAVGSQGVSRNQIFVIECLQKHNGKNLMNAGLMLDRVRQLIQNFTSTEMLKRPSPDGWRPQDGELVYYASCLDLLVGIAEGRSNNLINKPFVSDIFSSIHALALLNKVQPVEDVTPVAVVTRHLRTRWLHLLQLLLYDVDKTLYDTSLMSSPSHFEFLEKLLTSMEALLTLGPVPDTPRAVEPPEQAVPSNFKALDQEKEEYLAAILNCIDSFFNGPFQACINKDETAGEQLQVLGRKYLKRFQVLERSVAFRARLPSGSVELLSVAAYRVMTAVEGKADAATLQEVNKESRTDTKALEVSSPDQELWHRLIQALRQDPRCQERLRQQSHLLGQAFLTIYEETDPEYPPYLKNLTSETEMDFRRHAITVQDCIHRLVQHCEANLTDLPSLRRTMRVFLAMIGMAQEEDAKKEDTQQLTYIQVELSKAGVGKLLVKVLNNHAVQDVQRLAWHVLGELLQSRGPDGEAKVNKVVQFGLHDAMSSSDDDTGMWESFHEILSTAGRAAKFVHGFRTLPVLTSQEKARLREYDDLLEQAVDAIQAVRMLVEGQFTSMQDYLYSQEGNVRSFNVPGLCCWLLTRMCKDAQGTNYSSLSELKCVKFVVVLLTELAQGPNPRNQEFLSNMGLIELVFKLLMVNFQQLQKSEGDVYPSAVRQLKAELLRMLLSLMEGRLDARIHQTILQRGDPLVIRQRIEFVYLYFTLGAVAINPRQVTRQNLAAIPLDGNLHALILPQADPSELFTAVSRNTVLATEFLEDLDDEQLGVLFAEGFCLIELVYELSAHSNKFKKEVMPLPEEQDPFVDSEAEYRTRRDYLRERAAWQKRQIYRQAFDFLGRYVKTLEVVLNGHLQSLNFRVPVTAVWYVQGASKQRILDEVPFSLPDVKMKSFVHMCVELNNESRLILALSRFSLCPQRYRRWAQLYLPDGVHRPFWVFLANDAKHMQNLMRSSLYLSLCLALHAGLFLVAPKDTAGDLMWASPMAQRISEILGALHLACTMLWLCLFTCIQVPLSIKKVQTQYPKRNSLVNICAAWGRYMSQRLLQWRAITLILTSLALFRQHWWVYSFLLADFFAQSPSLQTVLSGVVAPAWPLFMTFLGAGIITFVYGAIGLHNFRDEFGMYCDENIMVCTQSILYMGTRSGIVGLSGMMHQVGPEDDTWFQRMVYDISYFVIFGVMLLNTIVALIVDSFQTQRREATARENNLETQSFISSIDRKVIESVAQSAGIVDGFEYHETYKQNKWDYMAFVFHLREKHALNFTGPESQIRQFIDNSDVTWLPIGRSKMLEGKSEESQEDTLTLIQKQNSQIIGALQQTQDNRKTLFKAIGSLARSMRDKTDSVQEQLKVILADHSESAKDSPVAGIFRSSTKKMVEPAESRRPAPAPTPAPAPAEPTEPEESAPPTAFARPRRLSMY